MVIHALVESGRVSVLETQLANETTLAPQFLFTAVVTRLDEGPDVGVGARLGLFGALYSRTLGINARASRANAVVLIRVCDGLTGHILTSQRGEASARGAGFGVDTVSLESEIDLARFQRSSVGKALRCAVERAVSRALAELDRRPWEARIVEIERGRLFIDAGTVDGLKPGDQLTVVRVTKVVVDPETATRFGVLTQPVGRVVVVKVADTVCEARAVEGASFQEGDLVQEPR
jgi:hypothetical protein